MERAPQVAGPQVIGQVVHDGERRVQHVGVIRCKVHRPVEGIVKTAALKRDGDKWFLVLSCDLGDGHVIPSN